MVANGELDAEFLKVESEHSAMAAVIGAQATGVRSYTATASAGLALMHEMLGVASGMRLPIVMNVANRALSSPLNIWNDWSDSMAEKDMGWLQFYCETAQEAFDTTVQAFRIAEHKDVLLPVMVCVDGFYLSHIYEPVDIPKSLDGFVGEYKPYFSLDTDKPITQGTYATPEHYQEFKEQQHIAMLKAKDVVRSVNKEFEKMFSRSYGDGLVETTNMENAKHAIITMGTLSGTIKHILEKDSVRDVGLVRLRSFRPFPDKELVKILEGVESVGVLEKDVSFGLGGEIYLEIKSFVNKPMAGFIGGLGGRDITVGQIKNIFKAIREKKEGVYWVGSKTDAQQPMLG
jgi:pyruvate ferredoxin oxidoreductase alpha subunit